jgi:hypothetical protein
MEDSGKNGKPEGVVTAIERPQSQFGTSCAGALVDFPSRFTFRESRVLPDLLRIEALNAWGADLFLSTCCVSSVRFPLTPALSRGARENPRQLIGEAGGVGTLGSRPWLAPHPDPLPKEEGTAGGGLRNAEPLSPRQLTAVGSPSRWGEGRGEGEPAAQQNQSPKTDLRPQWS